MTDETTALAALLRDEIPIMPTRGESDQAWHEWYAQFALNLADRGVRVAPSPDAPGLREAARAVVDAQPMDWSVPSLHPDHIEVHENAFDALMDAIDALDRALDDTPIRTVTTPDGQVYRAHVPCCWCGEHHEEGQ